MASSSVRENTSGPETALSHRGQSNRDRHLEVPSQSRTWADVAAGRLGQATRDDWIHEGLNGETFDILQEDLEDTDDDDEDDDEDYEYPMRYHRQHLARYSDTLFSDTQASEQGSHSSATDLLALGSHSRASAGTPEFVDHEERCVAIYELLFRSHRRRGRTTSDAHRLIILDCYMINFAMDYDPWVADLLADYFDYLVAEQEEDQINMFLQAASEPNIRIVEIETPYYRLRVPIWDPEDDDTEDDEEGPARREPSTQIALDFSDLWLEGFWFDADARTVGCHRLVMSGRTLVPKVPFS
jgi:hypothetical protein